MFIVNSIINDLREALGQCTESVIFRRLDQALSLLQPMLPTDSNIGVMDLCVTNCEFTLPYYVEIPLAVNIGGHPADFHNKWYEHHLNGVGSTCCGEACTFSWQNEGLYPVFRDPLTPSYVACYMDGTPQATITQSIKIFGEDADGKPLYSEQGTTGVFEPGLIIPITSGVFSLSTLAGSPKIKRITQVVKPLTNNFVRLVAYDSDRQEGTLLGYYRPDETAPNYRRMKLTGLCSTRGRCTGGGFEPSSNCCDPSLMHVTWVRMRYQRRQNPITSVNDIIFVPSTMAVIFAVQAARQYVATNSAEGDKYLALARGALEEKQESLEGPNYFVAQYPNDQVYGGDGVCNMI